MKIVFLVLIILFIQTAGDDYTVVTIQLVFDSTNDDQMLCINIPIINDTICEDIEVINILMTTTDPDVTISTPATTVTIIDDDGGLSMIL